MKINSLSGDAGNLSLFSACCVTNMYLVFFIHPHVLSFFSEFSKKAINNLYKKCQILFLFYVIFPSL